MVNLGDPPTLVRGNSTIRNRNPNLTQFDHVQVPTIELEDMKDTMERVTKELHKLKSLKGKELVEGYS